MSKVTCYSDFVSALSVGLVSLCPSPSGLNYFVMAALKCHNSLQFLASIYRHVGAIGILPDLVASLNKGQLRAVLVLSASQFKGCDAIVRSGISFHGESFKIESG